MRCVTFYAIFLACCLPCFAFAGESGLNPKYIKWYKEHVSGEIAPEDAASGTSSRISGRIPTSLDLSHMKNKSIVPEGTAWTAPTESSYDLRDEGYVTPVRNQSPYGTCWAFAAMACCESSALKQGYTLPDYSEKHLAYFGYTDVSQLLPGYDRLVLPAPDSVYDQGGNDLMALAMFSRWTGIVSEADEPYENMGPCEEAPTLPSGIPAKASRPNTIYIKDMPYAPGGSNVVDNIKYLLKRYGAISIGIYVGTDAEFAANYNSSTYAFYAPQSTDSDHAVAIVGWDDTYSKTNFTTQPTNDGAFIVRNSWGTGWGDGGYFYLSYEDPVFQDEGGWAYHVGSRDGYAIQVGYDPLGVVDVISPPGADTGEQWMAIIFEGYDEVWVPCGLFVPEVDVTVTINWYVDVDGDDPVSGSIQSDDYFTPLPGYHVRDPGYPVWGKYNSNLAIVVKLESDSGEPLIAIESKGTDTRTSKAGALPSQCFVSNDGVNWVDLTTIHPNASVCLKGFAQDLGRRPAVILPLTLE